MGILSEPACSVVHTSAAIKNDTFTLSFRHSSGGLYACLHALQCGLILWMPVDQISLITMYSSSTFSPSAVVTFKQCSFLPVELPVCFPHSLVNASFSCGIHHNFTCQMMICSEPMHRKEGIMTQAWWAFPSRLCLIKSSNKMYVNNLSIQNSNLLHTHSDNCYICSAA